MAICTVCGTVMHEDDVKEHVHSDIPKKGEPKVLVSKATMDTAIGEAVIAVKPITEEPAI